VTGLGNPQGCHGAGPYHGGGSPFNARHRIPAGGSVRRRPATAAVTVTYVVTRGQAPGRAPYARRQVFLDLPYYRQRSRPDPTLAGGNHHLVAVQYRDRGDRADAKPVRKRGVHVVTPENRLGWRDCCGLTNGRTWWIFPRLPLCGYPPKPINNGLSPADLAYTKAEAHIVAPSKAKGARLVNFSPTRGPANKGTTNPRDRGFARAADSIQDRLGFGIHHVSPKGMARPEREGLTFWVMPESNQFGGCGFEANNAATLYRDALRSRFVRLPSKLRILCLWWARPSGQNGGVWRSCSSPRPPPRHLIG